MIMKQRFTVFFLSNYEFTLKPITKKLFLYMMSVRIRFFFFHILHFYIFQGLPLLTLQTVPHHLDYFKVLFVLCTTYVKYVFSSLSKQFYKYLTIYLKKENNPRTSLLCFKTTTKTFYSSNWNSTRLTIHLKSTVLTSLQSYSFQLGVH